MKVLFVMDKLQTPISGPKRASIRSPSKSIHINNGTSLDPSKNDYLFKRQIIVLLVPNYNQMMMQRTGMMPYQTGITPGVAPGMNQGLYPGTFPINPGYYGGVPAMANGGGILRSPPNTISMAGGVGGGGVGGGGVGGGGGGNLANRGYLYCENDSSGCQMTVNFHVIVDGKQIPDESATIPVEHEVTLIADVEDVDLFYSINYSWMVNYVRYDTDDRPILKYVFNRSEQYDVFILVSALTPQCIGQECMGVFVRRYAEPDENGQLISTTTDNPEIDDDMNREHPSARPDRPEHCAPKRSIYNRKYLYYWLIAILLVVFVTGLVYLMFGIINRHFRFLHHDLLDDPQEDLGTTINENESNNYDEVEQSDQLNLNKRKISIQNNGQTELFDEEQQQQTTTTTSYQAGASPTTIFTHLV
ncbi:hypothetical protein RDWZM_010545 [Blomia tropicalis]|uniref:Uncharacterized protein n=1 Tax=Blomia tropicalis TaxID=40697 RepID=A0A9Q0LYP7_BLOTA|nr:hypothetical protein RDWZM_010545 [Blomia tropicalis]